jgi:hypothetical protein
MRSILLTASLLLTTKLIVLSQINQGDLVFDFTGNYDESITSEGVETSYSTGKTKTLGFGLSVGQAIGNSLIIGLGTEFYKVNDLQHYSFSYYMSFHLIEEMKSETRVAMPFAYIKYYRNITEKLSFCIDLRGGYGFVNTEYTSTKAGISYFSEGTTGTYANTTTKSDKSKMYQGLLQPVLNYLITPKLGLSIRVGGISYTSHDSKESEWKIRVNPSEWQYGVFLRLGK